MRLLVVSSWFPYPLDNGSRLRIFHLLEALGRRHDITLITVGRPDGLERVDPLLTFCRTVHVVPAHTPARLRLSGLFSRVPRHYAQTLDGEFVSLIASHAQGHDVAMAMQIRAAVHLVEARVPIPSLFEEVELGAARLPDIGGGVAPLWRQTRHRLTWWKHRRFVLGLLSHVQGATVVSVPERTHLAALGYPIQKIAVVPNAVALHEGPAEPVRRQRQIIYPGSVIFSANLDAVTYFVRDVWPAVRNRHPDLRFLVTGHTGDVDVSQLAAVEGVRFTGNLDDVRPAIAESLACVVPLRAGGGTRLKVLESMALGTPVVSTSKGIEGLDLQPEQHVLVGDTAGALVARVLQVLEDPARALQLATSALERVRAAYTWERSAESLEEHLRGVAVATGPAREAP